MSIILWVVGAAVDGQRQFQRQGLDQPVNAFMGQPPPDEQYPFARGTVVEGCKEAAVDAAFDDLDGCLRSEKTGPEVRVRDDTIHQIHAAQLHSQRAGATTMIGHADRFALLLGDQEAHLATAGKCLMNVHKVGVCDRRWQFPGEHIQWV